VKIATGLIRSLIVLYLLEMLLAGSAEATEVVMLAGLEFVASGEDCLAIAFLLVHHT
jgi:hypothetical protein